MDASALTFAELGYGNQKRIMISDVEISESTGCASARFERR